MNRIILQECRIFIKATSLNSDFDEIGIYKAYMFKWIDVEKLYLEIEYFWHRFTPQNQEIKLTTTIVIIITKSTTTAATNHYSTTKTSSIWKITTPMTTKSPTCIT